MSDQFSQKQVSTRSRKPTTCTRRSKRTRNGTVSRDAPATVDPFTGYWLYQPHCDRLGRATMKIPGPDLRTEARLRVPSCRP
jgi:hypothetical protein